MLHLAVLCICIAIFHPKSSNLVKGDISLALYAPTPTPSSPREAVTPAIHQQVAVNAWNKDGRTALMWACKSGQYATVRYLLEVAHADVAMCMKDASTAFDWAVLSGHLPTMTVVGITYARPFAISLPPLCFLAPPPFPPKNPGVSGTAVTPLSL